MIAEPFRTDEELRDQLARLRAARDEEMQRLHDHLHALEEPEMRGALVKDAVYDTLRATKPFRFLASFIRRWDR